MMKRSPWFASFLVLGIAWLGMGSAGTASADPPIEASDQAVQDLIRELGNPAYETRTSATRKLMAIGVRARKSLEVAAQGGDFEIALRARQLLETYDRVLLAGVEVSLAFSKPTAQWNEPVDLLVTLENRSAFPARAPFESVAHGDEKGNAEASQVARMLDIADWLRLKDPTGRDVDLRVDDIALDEEVVAVVQARLNHAPTTMLEADTKVTVRVPGFNRGWARFPMLEEGSYTLTFDYQPDWEDAELASQQVGRVVSKPATVQVTRAAPPGVSRVGTLSKLTLQRTDGTIRLTLVNSSDQDLVINRSFGMAPPFAQGRWQLRQGEVVHEIPATTKTSASWDGFTGDSLATVGPGDSVEVLAVEASELAKRFVEAGADLSSNDGVLMFAYSNQCDRRWQIRQGATLIGNAHAPPTLQTPLPRRLLGTHQRSDEIPVTALRVP